MDEDLKGNLGTLERKGNGKLLQEALVRGRRGFGGILLQVGLVDWCPGGLWIVGGARNLVWQRLITELLE